MKYEEFLNQLSSPARNALLYHEVDSFEKLAALTEKEFLSLHGIGPKSLPIAIASLRAVGMNFRIQ